MVIEMVGAGLPRTGTSSLREALRHLLGAPVHHMSEAFAHPEQAATWVRAMGGEPPVWEQFLAGYAAGVDAPFSNCWRELARAYPDAPVLLSHRGDPEVWLRSMEATVLPRTREMLVGGEEDPMVPLFRVLFRDVFTDLEDRDALVAGYERRLREVRASVPAERLVEWQPEDGWGPLCEALRLPVPERPFPHENSTADHAARHPARAARDAARRTSSAGDVRTSRLLLHPVDVEEAQRIAAASPDPGDRWLPDFPAPGDVVGATAFLRGCAELGDPRPFGLYRITRADDGVAIGGIGFRGVPHEGRVEVGYGLAPSARGHGYAAEALAGLVALAREHDVITVAADVGGDNVASRRALERTGFAGIGRRGDLHLFELDLRPGRIGALTITPDEWPRWRRLRQAALAEAPQAFGSTLADWTGAGDREDRWRSRLEDVDHNVVLDRDGADVGMVSVTATVDGRVELLSLWVDPGARGHGVGDLAVEHCLEWAGRAHLGADVVLSVKQDNDAARRLYERHGFVDAGVSPDDQDERSMVRLSGTS